MKQTKVNVKEVDEKTNRRLRQHVKDLPTNEDEGGWEYATDIDWFYTWFERLNNKFKLELPSAVISMKKLRKTKLGAYLLGRNETGLKYQIIINEIYRHRPEWLLIGTLFHEMIHLWQHEYGKVPRSGHHNKELIAKAKRYGVIITRKGVTTYEEGPFIAYLRSVDDFEVDLSQQEEDFSPPEGVRKKRIKFECQCPMTLRFDEDALVDITCNVCHTDFINSEMLDVVRGKVVNG